MNTIKQAIDFLTYAGFKAPVNDALYPIGKRLRSSAKLAYLYVGVGVVRTASLRVVKGSIAIEHMETLIVPTGINAMHTPLAQNLRKKTNCSSVVVQIGELDSLQMHSGVRRANPEAELITISREPKAMIGTDVNEDCRYALLPHPGTNIAAAAATPKAFVESVLAVLASQKLTVLRTQSAPLAILSVALAQPQVASGSADVLLLDNSNAIIFRTNDAGSWEAPRLIKKVLNRSTEDRDEKLTNLLEDTNGRKVLLIDTRTHADTDVAKLSPNFIRLEGLKDEEVAPLSVLLDNQSGDLSFNVPNILRGLAHDLGTINTQATPLLPGWAKYAAAAIWLFLGLEMAAAVYVGFQSGNLARRESALKDRRVPIEAQIASTESSLKTLELQSELINKITSWVNANPMLEPLLVGLSLPMDERVTANALFIKREASEGFGSTHRLNLSFSTDPRAQQILLQNLKQGAESAGWEMTPDGVTSANGITSLEAYLRPIPKAKTNSQ